MSVTQRRDGKKNKRDKIDCDRELELRKKWVSKMDEWMEFDSDLNESVRGCADFSLLETSPLSTTLLGKDGTQLFTVVAVNVGTVSRGLL